MNVKASPQKQSSKADYEPSRRNEPIRAKPLKTEPARAPPAKPQRPALNSNFGGGMGAEASKISGGGKKSYANGTVPDDVEEYEN